MPMSNASGSAAQLKTLLSDLGNPKAKISLSRLSLLFKGVGIPDARLKDELSDILLDRLARIDAHNKDAMQMKLHLHTALLALCLLTSALSESSQAEYLKRVLVPLSQGTPVPGHEFVPSDSTSEATNFHLSYLDQFVSSDGRKIIHGALARLSPDKVAAYPPIYDYKHAWDQMKAYDKLFKKLGKENRPKPTVYMFMSVKGGVGKTSAALGLATCLLKNGESCGILDLDFSGPSLQFHLDIPKISEALNFASKKESSTTWAYPTFYDLTESNLKFKQKPLGALVLTGEGVPSKPERGEDDLHYPVLVLPDSPTLNSVLSQKWDSPDGRRKLLPAIETALESFAENGVENVAIDMRPGLYGANGLFLRFISSHYPTYLILIGTPRLSDFATAVYECSWLSASDEFQWAGPTQYVVNMWNAAKSEYPKPLEAIDAWADRCISAAFAYNDGSHQHDRPAQSSGLHIHATRIWPYYYYRADLPRTSERKVNISVLPSDDDVRELQDLKEASFGIDIGSLTKSEWYAELSRVFAGVNK
jgi:hypothetical protein